MWKMDGKQEINLECLGEHHSGGGGGGGEEWEGEFYNWWEVSSGA